MSIAAATRARIEAAHRFSAFYRGYLANHLPMALVALDAMGGGEIELARFQARYESALEPLQAAQEAIAAGDEDRHLGNANAFPAWVDYFVHRIAQEGSDHVLALWLDRLATGIGSGAFHGVIRTAYALESDSPRELAYALAYWASAHEDAGPPAEARGDSSPAEVLASIAADPQFAGQRFAGANIAERTRNAAAQPSFPVLVERADPAQLRLESIAAALIGAYGASGNFTILHGVTGCHAFRLLAPRLRDGHAGVAQLWNAIVAAYLGCGSPSVEGWRLEGDDRLEWSEIHRRALACDDEHDVKLAYSCWSEGAHYGNDLYRRVASAVVCTAQREAIAC